MVVVSQCLSCELYEDGTCVAFPEGIPGDVLKNEHDHRSPHPDQKGDELWKSNGAPHPIVKAS